MGGFEGGDEGGFWDIDILTSLSHQQNSNKSNAKCYIETSDSGYSIKAHAKVIKITDIDKPSEYICAEDLYDTISFVPCKCDIFTIEGCDNIPLESNTIYKAFHALNDFTNELDILDFFHLHKVVVTKGIPSSVGFGGASSDAAAFLHLVKEVCNLILSTDELGKIASQIGADGTVQNSVSASSSS
jgi:4-diphosphocytidyl-2-C-methyl-D-erythritol kinase